MLKYHLNILINKIENSKGYYFLFLFLLFILARNFIEPFSTGVIPNFTIFVHWSIFYIALIIPFIIIIKFITNENIIKITKIFFSGSFLILLTPIIDIILSNGSTISYIDNSDIKNILFFYLSLLGLLNNQIIHGITLGMKIEIIIILLLSSAYSILKTKSISKGLITFCLLYSIGFIFGAMPYFMGIIYNNFNFTIPANRPLSGLLFWLIIIFIFLNIYYFTYNKKSFFSLWKNIRPLRALHFYGMFFYGFIISNGSFNIKNILDLYSLITTIISIFFAGVFSLINNDITDIEIDRISNIDRPLVKKTINITEYKFISILCLILSFLYSYFSRINSIISILFVIIFILNYYLYSNYPFRLKKYPIISKLIISINSLLLILYGYYFNNESLIGFPINIIIFIIIFITLAINFIDIKDYNGDLRNGIYTIPTLFGIKISKVIISIFVFIAFFIFPFFINFIKLLPITIILGLLEVYLINRKKFRESYIFCIYLFILYSLILFNSNIFVIFRK